MKICIISNLYPPHTRGGAEKIVQLQANMLKNQGHEVIVISTKPKRRLVCSEENGIKIYRFKPLNLFYYLNDHKHSTFVRFLWQIYDTLNDHSMFKVNKVLKKEKPNIVITHNLKGIGMLTLWAIRYRKIKHMHTLHDIQLIVPSGLMLKNAEKTFLVTGWPTKFYQKLIKWIFKSPDIIASPSNWLLELHDKYNYFPKSKKVVLRNPLSSTISSEAKQQKQNSYLFIGQLEEHKGIKFLVNFWKQNNIQSKLFIAGVGKLNSSDFGQNQQISFEGHVSQNRLKEIFKTIDFLIMPSLCYENSPTVILEAMQNATPAICADIGGAAELVKENNIGFTFEAADPQSFEAVLSKAANISNEEFRQLSEKALNSAAKYNQEKYIQQLNQLLT
jgi:glycosyltransferase involved in cell wall biosynthesis